MFGRSFTLLAGPAGGAWRDQARLTMAKLGVTVDVYQEGYGLAPSPFQGGGEGSCRSFRAA